MSIIDSKYRNKYQKGTQDWLGNFIDEHATDAVMKTKTVTAEDGTKTETQEPTGKRSVNLQKLFDLATANAINVDKYRGDVDKKNAPGRLRMTIGNMLRAAAKKRHGLNDPSGTFVDAPAEFIGDSAKTHNPDGSKIAVPKAQPATETPAEADTPAEG